MPRAIEQLAGLQAQWPPAPYIGLWSRLARFRMADLERALDRRSVVKATLMRGTLHIVSARDYPAFAVAVPEARRSGWATVERAVRRAYAAEARLSAEQAEAIPPLGDPRTLHRALLRAAREPLGREDVASFFARSGKIPLGLARHLVWQFIAAFGELVHVPPSGRWSERGSGRVVAARGWLGDRAWPSPPEAAVHTVRRHLGAFGPATLADISSWSHLRVPVIREAIASLGRAVASFEDHRGRELYDLAGAPRPSPDTAAPPRYLAKWDSTMLAYTPAERVRILPAGRRAEVIIKNGDVAQTFLIDGFVSGTWEVTRAKSATTLTATPFGKLAKADRISLLEEGERLVRFVAPDASSHAARVAS